MEKYITARGVTRSSVTRLIGKIENILIKPEVNIDEISDNIELLNEKEKELNEFNSKIFEVTKNEDIEKELESVEMYKENIILCRNKMTRLKAKLNANAVSQPNITENNNDFIWENNIRSSVKLPRLSIEQFDGEICKWPNFWSRFRVLIHENNALSKVEKFSYLKSYLTKDAERAISGLSVIEENYDKVIKILESRFGRKDLIIDKHMTALLRMAPCKNSKDITSLRKVYDTCELQINSLRSLGVEIDTFGTLLFPILIKSLPSDIVLLFTRNHSSEENKITDLLEFLKLEVESRERSSLLTETQYENKNEYLSKSRDTKVKKNHYFDNKERKQSTAILNITTERYCIFCEKLGNHVSDDCNCYNLTEKRNLLKQNGRCYSCYKKFHTRLHCRSKIECRKCGSKEHRKGLCDKIIPTRNTSNGSGEDSSTIVTSVVPVTIYENYNKSIYMPTFKAFIVASNKRVKVRCLLDCGSERSFIRQQVSKKLNLSVIGNEKINLHTFGNSKSVKLVRSKVHFKLCNLNDENKIVNIEAFESPEICGALVDAPRRDFIERIQSLNIELSDILENNEVPEVIDVLIGCDFFWQVVTGVTKRLTPSLALIETLMGWAIQGPGSFGSSLIDKSVSVNVLNAITSRDPDDDRLASTCIKAFWELESIGIKGENVKREISDDEAYQSLKCNLKFENNKYEVRLPWKHEDVELNDNYDNARKRLNSLVRRFRNDPNLYKDYKEVIDEYLRLGIVEPVDDADKTGKVVYFLPHHPVIRKDKDTTKLRIVFDASSHPPSSPSLNDLLHPGPNLNPDLLNLLLKFRFNIIAFVADVEKAFLMISLDEKDRDAVRFLWIDELPEDLSQIQPKTLRLTRVLFGVTSSPFLLSGVIKTHLNKYFLLYPETCRILNESMYVDDLLSGASTEEEAFKRSEEARLIMKQAGMTLRKWKSNSSALESLWEKSEFEIGPKDSIHHKTVPLKVLGLIWDRHKDIFQFDVNKLIEFIENSDRTKRTIIRAAGRIFDPTGFLSPFTMKLKMLFQELWERGVHWDEELPDDIACKWKKWCEELPLINNLEIPRYCFGSAVTENLKSIQVHCFTDSSETAYGAVVYIRYTDMSDDAKVTFLLSKGRLAPLKKLTVPRLELTAALIGARLISHIKPIFQNLHVDVSYHCWTDSNIALCWIKGSSSRWKPYVANRVREIQSLTDPEIWHHCPGQTNPADLITKERRLLELISSNLWWYGPKWLLEQKNWPRDTTKEPDSIAIDSETRKVQISLLTSVKEDIFDLKRFENLMKSIRVTAYIKRFINNLKSKNKRTGALDSNEISESELFWISRVQRSAFSAEYEALKCGKELPNDSPIKCFDPYLDDEDLIRVGGRLQYAEIAEDEKHPILLPYSSEFSELLVKRCHEKVAHCGLAATLAEIRTKYYIIKARKLVKSTINKCLICRRYKAKAFVEKTAPLPADRITMCSAFEVSGVDFAGPLYIKDNNTLKPSLRKAYICLFTCASIRAIHLELVTSLHTETFILAFKRFINRRGICRAIYSDNAATFQKADKELQLWLQDKTQEIQNYLGSQRIEWKFITPLAPWWGGFWERMIRSVKTCLKKILGKALLTYEEMTTVLTDVEAILNSRPLTYTYDDVSEPTPLTPAHFLVGKRLITLPTRTCSRGQMTDLRKRFRYQQILTEHFWKKWKTQYLLDLRSNHMLSPSQGSNIKINDVVLIGENREPRQTWHLGKIVDVHPGRDGKVRSCSVKTSKGILKRPIQLLYNLEVTEK